MEYTIDAKDKILGRIASEAAVLLMGKNSANFQKNIVADAKVNIINVSKMSIDPKKMKEKEYFKFSGYPSGLKRESLGMVIEKKGHGEILRKAVYGMLPSNKLRPIMMKNLIIDTEESVLKK